MYDGKVMSKMETKFVSRLDVPVNMDAPLVLKEKWESVADDNRALGPESHTASRRRRLGCWERSKQGGGREASGGGVRVSL